MVGTGALCHFYREFAEKEKDPKFQISRNFIFFEKGANYSKKSRNVRSGQSFTYVKRVHNAPVFAEVFSPRTMAAPIAGDKPIRLSAAPARVRRQWPLKEKYANCRKRKIKEENPPTIPHTPHVTRPGLSRASACLSLSSKMTKIPTLGSSWY